MDGVFNFNGESIKYKIIDNSLESIQVVRGVEKMGRYIYFYNSQNESIGFLHVFDTVERMTNISSQDAFKWYEEYLTNK